MADLRQSERAKLPDSAFAYIDSTGRRRLPIHDEAHVRNALARFNRVLFEDDTARDRARTKLLKAAKRHGILPVGFIDGQIRPKLPTDSSPSSSPTSRAPAITWQRSRTDTDRCSTPSAASSARRCAAVAASRSMPAPTSTSRSFDPHPPRSMPRSRSSARCRTHAWPDGRIVRVRIGLHTGRPTRTSTGYQGISVNAASRLCACGHGGQILLSRAVHAAMADTPAYEMRHLGTHRLRGIPDEHDIYQLLAPDLDDGFPPLRLDEAVGAGYRIPH